ncbi:MAG: hypothetical protein PHC34_13480 [Candidatus Gastranaerophilales bacterium]|nr:hypothetical protein [Candidatus Gastranaerophilales bacterium]
MKQEIKSGQEVLDDFIASIKGNELLDKDTVTAVVNLYEAGKFTKTNLVNAMSHIREKNEN